MEKHNGFVSLWKFLFSIGIALYHVGSFNEAGGATLCETGYIFTEFFFLVSGYLMAKRCDRLGEATDHLGQETIRFLWSKVKSLLPYILPAHILGLLIRGYMDGFRVYNVMTSLWDLMFLQTSGLKTYLNANVPVWYLSAMLLSMWIIYPLLRKFKDNYALIFAPLSAILLLGYYSQNHTSLGQWQSYDSIVSAGLIRGFAELNLGIVAYKLAEYLKQLHFSPALRVLSSIGCFGLCAASLSVSTFVSDAGRYDYILLLFYFLAVSMAFSEKCCTGKLLNNGVVYYLERLSLPIYINHSIFRYLFQLFINRFVINYYARISLYLLSVLLFSILELWVLDRIRSQKRMTAIS